jgi:hypothetical protein
MVQLLEPVGANCNRNYAEQSPITVRTPERITFALQAYIYWGNANVQVAIIRSFLSE